MNQFIFTISRIFITLMLVLGTYTTTLAQLQPSEVWSIKRCVDYALETNLQLKQFEFDKRISEINLRRSKEQLLPDLRINSGLNRNIGRNINPITNEFEDNETINSLNMSLNSSLTLFQGLQNRYSIQSNKIALDASEYTIQAAQNDLILQITNAYLTILLNEEILLSTELQLNNISEQRDRTKKLVDAGSSPLSELANFDSQIADEEFNVTNARNQLELAYLNLQQILNLDPSQNFAIEMPELSDPEAPLHPSNPDEVYSYAESNQPSIKGAELRVLSAEKNISSVKGGWMPTLSFNAGTGTQFGAIAGTNPDVGSILNDNFNYGYGLNLFVPLYRNGTVRANLGQASVEKLRAQNQLEIEKQNLRQAIEQAHLDAVTSFSQFRQSERRLAFLKITLENTRKQFEVGISNAVDYLVAQNNLARARFDLIRFKYDYIFKSKVLDFYLGKPISL